LRDGYESSALNTFQVEGDEVKMYRSELNRFS
jgi:hypothetical protein